MPEDTNDQQQEPAQDNSAIKQMREAMERKDDTIASMRTQLVGGHLSSIGLNPDAGLGKAIAKGYDGDVSAEAIAAFAKDEYSYEPKATENPQAQNVQEAQQRADQFGSAAASVQPTSQEDVVMGFDQKLQSPEATRKDASNAIEAKLAHYIQQNQ